MKVLVVDVDRGQDAATVDPWTMVRAGKEASNIT